MEDEITAQIERFKLWLLDPQRTKAHDIIKRRLYALEQGIEYTNPFSDVDECLFSIWQTDLKQKSLSA